MVDHIEVFLTFFLPIVTSEYNVVRFNTIINYGFIITKTQHIYFSVNK